MLSYEKKEKAIEGKYIVRLAAVEWCLPGSDHYIDMEKVIVHIVSVSHRPGCVPKEIEEEKNLTFLCSDVTSGKLPNNRTSGSSGASPPPRQQQQ